MGNASSKKIHRQFGLGTWVGWPGLAVVEPHPDKRDQVECFVDDLLKKHQAGPSRVPVQLARNEPVEKESYKNFKPEISLWRQLVTQWCQVPGCMVEVHQDDSFVPPESLDRDEVATSGRKRFQSAQRPDDPGAPEDVDEMDISFLGPPLPEHMRPEHVKVQNVLGDGGEPTVLQQSVNSPAGVESLGEAHAKAVDVLVNAAALSRDFKGRYTLGKRLNSGAQGVTYLATANFSGRQVVVKKPNDAADISDHRLLASKSHPNIVRVYELFQEKCETYIVMEYCAGGDLFHAIEAIKHPTQNWTSAVFRQVVWGVRYLHDCFTECHNDIKPENIFLDQTVTGSGTVPRAMIGDFGCLTKIGRARSGGDPRYSSPEVLDFPAARGVASDAWALGVTLFEIASGGLMIYLNSPNLSSWDKFRTSGKWEKLMTCLRRCMPVSLEVFKGSELETEQLRELLSGLLSINVGRRWTLSQVLDCEWMQLGKSKKDVPFKEEVQERLQRRAQRHTLDIALLNLVGSMLQGQSLRYYENIWDRYDVDASGAMGFEEFERLVSDLGLDVSHGETKLPPMSATDLFALADGSHSGAIEFNEFVGLMFSPEQMSCEERASFVKHAFLTLAGEDGKLSAQELAGIFTNNSWAEARVSSEVIGTLFKQLDTDANGFVDYSEFAAYVDEL